MMQIIINHLYDNRFTITETKKSNIKKDLTAQYFQDDRWAKSHWLMQEVIFVYIFWYPPQSQTIHN